MQRNQNSSQCWITAVSVAAATDIVPFFIISKITRSLSFFLSLSLSLVLVCVTVVHQSITCRRREEFLLLLQPLLLCNYNTPLVNELLNYSRIKGGTEKYFMTLYYQKIDELSILGIVIALLGTARCKKVNYRTNNSNKKSIDNFHSTFFLLTLFPDHLQRVMEGGPPSLNGWSIRRK